MGLSNWCEHCELPVDQCQHALPGPAFVYISGGGLCYHQFADCEALLEGQIKAERENGYEPREISSASMARAAEKGRVACAVCFARSYRKVRTTYEPRRKAQ